MCGNVETVHVGQLLYESEGGVGCYEDVGARVRNERVGVERKNGEGVCGGTEERNVVQRAGVGSVEEGRIRDLIQRKLY